MQHGIVNQSAYLSNLGLDCVRGLLSHTLGGKNHKSSTKINDRILGPLSLRAALSRKSTVFRARPGPHIQSGASFDLTVI
jgi:hypothetical protein